ncbi:MAG: 30S ribosomal protein S18 [Pyrinomonadaceae bacterium]|nr:30S ribosomal protein S18 [Pyrinomonadaceae bacterium]MCX7640941.1 30S ribosomal protein S18 [Pyrinomonadaceae bacterium]MDW8304723.1 30S ribosomal protein S18 [Acidobacteriota bacterium]
MEAEKEIGMKEIMESELSKQVVVKRTSVKNKLQIEIPDYIDWKDVEFLKQFIPERGKIMPRRISGITARQQRKLAKAIKRARIMALLPFVKD